VLVFGLGIDYLL